MNDTNCMLKLFNYSIGVQYRCLGVHTGCLCSISYLKHFFILYLQHISFQSLVQHMVHWMKSFVCCCRVVWGSIALYLLGLCASCLLFIFWWFYQKPKERPYQWSLESFTSLTTVERRRWILRENKPITNLGKFIIPLLYRE